MKIEGIYRFFQDGKCIGEHKNNITETGRVLAIKTLMGAIPNFGGSIHLGIDSSYNIYGYAPTQIVVSGTTPSQTVVITVSSHTLSTGNTVSISGITATGITALNGTTQVITATTSTTITFTCTTSITNATYSTAGTLGTFGQLATNTRLGFRVNSTPVLSSNIDNSVAYDAILFKAKIDDPSYYKIYEVGLYSDALLSGGKTSRNELLVSFEPSELVMNSDSKGITQDASTTSTRFVKNTDSTYGTYVRVGTNALFIDPDKEAKTSSGYNLEYTESTDIITLAYYATGAGSLNIDFYSGTSYTRYTVTTTASGYGFASFQRGSGTVSGAMDWSNVSKIVFDGTTSGVNFILDGLRIDQANIINTHNGLVSRTSLVSSPITKNAGSPLDIEYHMRLSFNG